MDTYRAKKESLNSLKALIERSLPFGEGTLSSEKYCVGERRATLFIFLTCCHTFRFRFLNAPSMT